MKKILLTGILSLGVALWSHAQMPPGGGGTNVYVPPPPPTSGLYITPSLSPEGKIPCVRFANPGGDPDTTNFNGKELNFISSWTGDTNKNTGIGIGDVVVLVWPVSTTNISTNWPAFSATYWWTRTNGDQSTTVFSRSTKFDMQPGTFTLRVKIGVTNVLEPASFGSATIHPNTVFLTTNYIPYGTWPNVDPWEYYWSMNPPVPPSPYPPIWFPGMPGPDPNAPPAPPEIAGPYILTPTGPVLPGGELKNMVKQGGFQILTEESSGGDQYITTFDYPNISGIPHSLYHLQIRHTLDDSSPWVDVTNSAVWLDDDGKGSLQVSITNSWRGSMFSRLQSHPWSSDQ